MQPLCVLVAHLLKHDAAAHFRLGEPHELRFFDFPGRGGNRRAVRIVPWLAQRIRHAPDQLLRHRMLQLLGLDVDVAPVVAQLAREVRFENAVTTDHLQRRATSLRSELHPAIRDVLDEPGFGEPLHHAADRRRRDREHFRNVARRRETALAGEMKNRFEVVFDGPCQRRLW